MKTQFLYAALALTIGAQAGAAGSQPPAAPRQSSGTVNSAPPYFNAYILKAVELLAKTRAGLGYANYAYTQDMPFGADALRASHPPLTMCVAAQMEIIVNALNIYAKETGDTSAYHFLTINQWRAVRSNSFRGKIWLANSRTSHGTADALASFGLGKEVPFNKLSPGAFVNLNRTSNHGHAVVFLGYIDKSAHPLEAFGRDVAGFRYFSSQGKVDNGGFGYRYAFFSDAGCPTLASGMKRDCGVIRSDDQKMLNSGQMWMPRSWDAAKRDAALKIDAESPKGPPPTFDFAYFDGMTTDDQ